MGLSCRDDVAFAVKAIDTQADTCDKSSLIVVWSRRPGKGLSSVFGEELMVRDDVAIRSVREPLLSAIDVIG